MRKRVQSMAVRCVNAWRLISVGVALLIMLISSIGVLAWNVSQSTKLAKEATGSYLMALQKTGHLQIGSLEKTNENAKNETIKKAEFNIGVKILEQVVASKVEGVSTLAKMQQAALAAQEGQTTKALALWNAVQINHAVAPPLRDMASFLWCQQQIDTGDPAVLRSRLFVLLNKGKAWQGLVTESLALLDIREGHRDAALKKLTSLMTLDNVSDDVRKRAQTMIQALNAPPAG